MANDDMLHVKRENLVMFAALVWRATHDETAWHVDESENAEREDRLFSRSRMSDLALRSWLSEHPEITAYPDSFVDMLPEYGNRKARQIMATCYQK